MMMTGAGMRSGISVVGGSLVGGSVMGADIGTAVIGVGATTCCGAGTGRGAGSVTKSWTSGMGSGVVST